MPWTSTEGRSAPVSLAEALRRGLAPDGGLYLPEHIEPMPKKFFESLATLDLSVITSQVARHLIRPELADEIVDQIVAAALDFPIAAVSIDEKTSILELFHGPTLAFKDFGARFLARLLAQTRESRGTSTVLVATSGDTGGAVAQAFFGVEGTHVIILYPHGRVSKIQERQFASLGGNIQALAVDGTFDDCQALVKQAFANSDGELSSLGLTSANSINIGRLLPQIFYYFQAAALIGSSIEDELIFSTPSGNFGNLTAGILARRLGLNCRFVAATNANDVVPEYLKTGLFSAQPSVHTLSNAMDVGNPSNLERIRFLYENDIDRIRADIHAEMVDDATTKATIRRVDRDHDYVLDPHTAVGYHALERMREKRPTDSKGIVLATAHPAKFREVVEPILARPIPLPERLAKYLDADVISELIPSSYPALRNRLLAQGMGP